MMNTTDNESNPKVTIKIEIEPLDEKECSDTEFTCTNVNENLNFEVEVPVFYEDQNLKEKFEAQKKSCVNTKKKITKNSNRKLNISENVTNKTSETDNEMSDTEQSLPPKDINGKNMMESDVLRDDLYYHCKICKVKYLSEKSLVTHMRFHDMGRKFKCTTCLYRYKSKAELAIHMMKHSETKFECEMCEYKSKWKSHFNRHIKQKHGDNILNGKHTNTNKTNNDITGSSEQYPTVPNIDNSQSQNKDGGNTLYHQCNICEYRSFVKHALDKHMKLHDPTRRNKCDVCFYRFNTKTDLIRHMSKHSDKKYSCRVCGRQFKYEQAVTAHMYVHEGLQYRCYMCGYICESKNDLSMHISHKHNNSYKCYICMKIFTDNSYYTRHMKKHLKKEMK